MAIDHIHDMAQLTAFYRKSFRWKRKESQDLTPDNAECLTGFSAVTLDEPSAAAARINAPRFSPA